MGFWEGFKDLMIGKDPEDFEYDEDAVSTGQGGADVAKKAGDLYDQSQNRGAPQGTAAQGTAATIDQSQQKIFRDQQLNLMAMLGDKAAGQGPFQSDIAMQQMAERNLAGQKALLSGQRGPSSAGAAGQAARAASGFNTQIAGQAAQARMQEQQGAQNMLAGIAQGGRGQDIGLAQAQADLMQSMGLANLGAQNNMNLANLQAKLQTMSANDRLALDALAQRYGVSRDEMLARLQMEQARFQASAQDAGILGGLIGAGGQILGSYLGMPPSDVGLKKDVREMLDKLTPYTYEYKDGAGMPPGRHAGVMAQNLEESDLGREMVIDTPEGKMVDYGDNLSTMMAGLASLNERLNELEGRSPKKSSLKETRKKA